MAVFVKNKALDRLEDRLRTLELKCDDLDRTNRKLDLEFTELYDKVRHQMSRMAKRDALARKNDDEVLEVEQDDLPFPDADPVSRSILLRRGRVGGKQ
jgi:predicted transcriptional regulator